jgi:hypothetical protein
MIPDARAAVARTSIRVAIAVAAILLALVVVVMIAGTPSSYWYEQRMMPRKYTSIPLATVIADLEANYVIPRGTTWSDESLKRRPVTVSWVWPSDKEALLAVSQVSHVTFTYQMGHHGEIWAPVQVTQAQAVGGLNPVVRRGPYRGVVVPRPAN